MSSRIVRIRSTVPTLYRYHIIYYNFNSHAVGMYTSLFFNNMFDGDSRGSYFIHYLLYISPLPNMC